MLRRLFLGILLASTAWSQALSLDCGPGTDISFSAAAPRVNLTFQGQQGEVVLFRFVRIPATPPALDDPTFRLNPLVIADQFGNTFLPRTAIQTQPNATPVDIATQGFEFDLPADSTFTLRLQSTNVNSFATLHVTLARVNRPCTNAPLTCGRSAAGTIAGLGQVDTFQYAARAGDTIALRLLRIPSGGTLDTSTGFFIAVYGPDGHVLNTVGANRIPFAQVFVRNDVKATADGNLTVVVFEATGSKGGLYYLSGVRLNGGCGGPALSCSSTLEAQLTTPINYSSFQLSAAAGDVYQVRVGRADTSGNFTPAVEVYDATGNRVGLVGPVSASGHAVATGIVQIPSSGTYSVLVSGPADGSAGTFTLATTRINRPCTDQAISCSAILDGAISGLLRSRIYALSASANDTFLVRLLKPDTAGLFRPRVDIFDGAGNQLQFVNTSDLGRVNFTASVDGTYTMVVTDNFDNAQSGSYSMSVLRLNRPCEASSLTCGGVVSGAISRTLAAGVYAWTAADGESFSVRMLGGAGGVQPSLEVYDPQGASVGSGFTGASSGVDVLKPSSGTYSIVALDNSKTPSAGSYAMELLRTKNACAALLPQGQTVSGVVSATAPFASYSFAASSGDILALRTASPTSAFSAQMELYDPEGQKLDASVFGLTRKLSASGTYTVILGAAAARTAGGYTLAFQLLNKPAGTTSLACGGSTAGSLAGANQFRYYTLAADAGDTVRLIFTRNDAFTPQVELFDPAGTRIGANSDVLQKVAAGGSYLMVVSPSTTLSETGAYTIAYQRPNNPCLPTKVTCGQTTLKQAAVPGQVDAFTFNGTAGDIHNIRLITRSGSYSPFVEMYNAAGTQLNTSSTGQIRRVLPADGLYTLLVRDRNAVNLGSYRVSVQDDSATCSVDDSEAPAIALVRPTGGEVLPGGTTFRLQWVSDDNVGVASHDISLSTDGGATFGIAVAGNVSGNAQAYDWILPSDIAPSRKAVVRITATDGAGNAQSVTSDLLTLIGSGFNANSSSTFTYDALNRLIQAAGDGRVVTYTWDPAGNLIQIVVQ